MDEDEDIVTMERLASPEALHPLHLSYFFLGAAVTRAAINLRRLC
jgi:hypothetical protein